MSDCLDLDQRDADARLIGEVAETLGAIPGHAALVIRFVNRMAEVLAENARALSEAARSPWPSQACADVIAERATQDAKWGEQNHDPFTYLTVLMEEVGELSQAALHARFGGHAAAGLRKEAVQTAAVALAIIECLDRDKWTWREDVDNNGNRLPLPPPPTGAEK